jgi:hypothetical protein
MSQKTVRPGAGKKCRAAAQLGTGIFAICALLVCSSAAIYYSNDIRVMFRSPATIPLRNPNTTGTVLTPFSGNTCRRRLLDNTTGKIRDDGLVDCADAMARVDQEWTKQGAVQRQTIFRNGFVSATGVGQ